MNERYVIRLSDTPNWERHSDARCSSCGELVVDNGREPATLICMDCLLKDAPPAEPIIVHGSDPWHCFECFDRMPPSGKTAPPWNGRA